MTNKSTSVEAIGELSIFRSESLGSGRFGTVFAGQFANRVDVAIKRMEKSQTKVDSNLYLKANGLPNLIEYYAINSTDIEFM